MEPIVLDDVFINEDELSMGEMNEHERFETFPSTQSTMIEMEAS